MKEHSFEMPIAINRNTNKIVHVNDVEGGIKCNCCCPICNEDLIAINKEENIQRPHFRHNKNANCSSNGETYIHWLTKEVFKEINQIFLPSISSNDLEINKPAYNVFINKLKKYFEEKDLLSECDKLIFTNFPLQSKLPIKINGCENEELHKSKFGDIKVDIVLKVGDQKLFIEPYITSKIVENKREKLVDLNISTISIDLRSFVHKNDWSFKIEDLKNFLITNISNKKWEFIRTSKVNKLTDDFIKKLDKEIKEHYENNIQENKKIKDLIIRKSTEMKKLKDEFSKLDLDICILEKRIIPFPFEKLLLSSPLRPLKINTNQF